MTEKDIVINNFSNGIADSDFLGFADMRNLDVYTYPGTAQINWSTVKETGSTITGAPHWLAYDSANQIAYCLDETGKVYKSSDNTFTSWSLLTGNTTGDINNGLIVWKDYLFAFRASSVDVYGPLSGTPSWTVGWHTVTNSGYKATYIGQDDKLYIACANKVDTIAEASAPFTPGTGASYTYVQAAITLQTNYRITSFAELGTTILLGTYKGAVAYGATKIADIFPYDRTTYTLKTPLRVSEFGVLAMQTINNRLYFLAGTTGQLYVSDGYTVQPLRKLYYPMQHSSTQQDTYGLVTVNTTADPYTQCLIAHRGKLYIAVSGSNAYTGPLGVWSLDLATNALTFEHQISTGSVAAAARIYVSSLLSISEDGLLITWYDQNSLTSGIDKVVTSARYTSYAAYCDSQMFLVGTEYNKASLSEFEIQLAKPLQTGQGVRLSYRTDTSASFTTIGTYDFATYGAIKSLVQSYLFPSLSMIQIRCELTTPASSATSPRLLSITLR